MSTRHAKPGGPLRQERYASSFEKGLLANLVAKRASVLSDVHSREIIWFLQWLSWRIGALDQCADAVKSTVNELTHLCLDPGYWPTETAGVVAKYRRDWLNRPAGGRVQTEIGEKLADALDYTKRFNCLTIIDGPARIGKTFETRAWCERSAGLARYVQVPCSNDDISFFRAIAAALGVSSSLQLKAAEIRIRIEEAMACRDIVIVLDEAHYLWPQAWQRYAMPSRVNWIMTALVNQGVGVALVTTPQFSVTQKKVEKLTGWNSVQFNGRIGHLERLPQRLSKRDLMAVAEFHLPEGDPVIWRALAAYAAVNNCNLASIDANIKRARWFAEKSGRATVTREDMRRVVMEITGENALTETPRDPARDQRAAPRRNAREVLAAEQNNFTMSGLSVPHLEST
jgi:hypothetical protein